MGNNISGKINLAMLKGSVKVLKGKSGDAECLVIPIELNHLFKGEKGVYLDIIAFELEKQREGSKDTHLIKQSLPKEVRAVMEDEEIKSMPILGNLTVWGNQTHTEQEPQMKMQGEDDGFDF